MYRQYHVNTMRLRLLRNFEKTRGSRVISLIHRQESLSFLGIPLSRYIDIEDSEQVLRAIRLTSDDMPIDLILHTPGGLVLAAEQIAYALQRHPAKVTVFIPHYAMSGGTLIALAADEIIMDENAVLGPVDPQLGKYPAVSILSAIEKKDPNEIDDETLIMGDIARKAVRQVEDTITAILCGKYGEEDAGRIAKSLTEGRWTHDYPITCEILKELGIKHVCTELPKEVYLLMDLYPQNPQRRPSVQFIPMPYYDDRGKNNKR